MIHPMDRHIRTMLNGRWQDTVSLVCAVENLDIFKDDPKLIDIAEVVISIERNPDNSCDFELTIRGTLP